MNAKAKRQLAQLAQQGEPVKAQIDEAFAEYENAGLAYIEANGMRTPAHVALRLLVVTGNVLIYIPPPSKDLHPWLSPSSGLRVFKLNQYVVVRDPGGKVLEIVVKESVSVAALPLDVQLQIKKPRKKPETKADLYTRIWWENGKYQVEQSAHDVLIPGSSGSYTEENLPWLALMWAGDGDYGRGHVEEYLGDFVNLETDWQSTTEGSKAMAKIIWLCNPNGVTRSRDVVRAQNLDVIAGREEDLKAAQVNKFADFQVTERQIARIEQRLDQAFLRNGSVSRQAERVTAEEIRYLARELEDTLGGQYSLLAQMFQLPVVRLVLFNLMKSGEIPELPKQDIRPVITGGLEALGRTHEQARTTQWLQDAGSVFGPEVVAQRVKTSAYMARSAINFGVKDSKELLITDEEFAQQQQTAQMNNTAGALAPELMKGMMQNGQVPVTPGSPSVDGATQG
jgi:hypothetical protein